MNQPVPPLLPPPIPKKPRTLRNIVQIIALILGVCLGAYLVFYILMFVVMGFFMSFLGKQMTEMGEIHFTSYRDTFQVTVLELKSGPGYFTERVRIRCERDMKASIWVTDLKAAGIFETNSPDGKIVYREGNPHIIGESAPVHAKGDFSTCDVYFRINTTLTNTIWHDEIASAKLDTTISTPLTVTGVDTNWPGLYERDFAIPLANLGDYKILLSVK